MFAPELPGLEREAIREWYNGYHWLGEDRAYNPFDILLLFDSRAFKAHWFETGSPRFLVNVLAKRRVRALDLDGMRGTEELLSAFDVDDIATEALLFQTGYLTIRGQERRGARTSYRLGYPNREVRLGLNESLLRHWVRNDAARTRNTDRLYDLLEENDLPGLEVLFRSFFASIPYEWYTNNDIANFEGYYASIFYSHFAALGLDVAVEESANRERLDSLGPPRHGGTLRGSRVRFRVQGGGTGRGRQRDGATQGPELRGQIPCAGRGCASDRRRIQQRVTQRGGIRARRSVTWPRLSAAGANGGRVPIRPGLAEGDPHVAAELRSRIRKRVASGSWTSAHRQRGRTLGRDRER